MHRDRSPEASARRSWRWSGVAVLFDLDGTLVDSGASVVRAWGAVADELGVPFSEFAPYVHGIPADEVLARVVPQLGGPERSAVAERMLIQQAEDTADVTAIAGAMAVLDQLPTNRWAIVTSGDLRLASSRIEAANLPLPRVLITADDVTAGKPDPQPYLLAARRLGAAAHRCLVVEDSDAGIAAGRAAGMPVLGVLTSCESLAGVTFEVVDFTEVSFEVDRAGIHATAA